MGVLAVGSPIRGKLGSAMECAKITLHERAPTVSICRRLKWTGKQIDPYKNDEKNLTMLDNDLRSGPVDYAAART